MKQIRLRTFIILSLVLHIVLITALVAVFLPKRGILRIVQTPISVGILTQGNGIDNAKDNSLDSFAPIVSRHKETQRKNQLDKMDMSRALDNKKTMDKTNQEKEKSTVKEYDKYNVNEEINNEDMRIKVKVAPESSATEIERSNKGITIGDPYEETKNQRTARISGNENMNVKRDFGTDSLGQNIELAFPNYKVNPKPRYPMLARRKGYEGTILLRVFVLESGGVGKVELEKSSGYEILDESALKAVREWIFIPGKKNGEPVPSWVTVPIKFQLNSG